LRSDDILTVAKANLKDAGIDMNIEKMEMSAWIDKVVVNGDYDVAFLGGDQARTSAPSETESGAWGPLNVARYANATVDELLAKGTQTNDQAARAEFYRQIQQIMADELPMVITNEMGMKYAVSSKIHGVPLIDDAARGQVGKMSFALVWIEK
jgi:peptide/nickel transport system substrate-binding protein